MTDCFHCGLPAPAGASFCCAGCEAVSRSISDLGLDDYYRLRSSPAPRPAADDTELSTFDDPLVQSRFVTFSKDGWAEAPLLLEGLRCSACAWLVEQFVARVPGVVALQLNYATRRAIVRWKPEATRLSAILGSVRRLGYGAWPYEEGRLALVEQRERRSLLRRLWVAGLGMMQVMMYAVPAYLAGEGEITADAGSLMRWAGLVLTLPVITYSSAPFFAGALRDLRLLRLGMDVPIALGLVAAFAASVAATLTGRGEVYFDSVTMFVFLITGGRYLELLARQRAGDALQHLARMTPETAHRFADDGSVVAVPAARLRVRDRVLVRPGETVPADGVLDDETAQVSEAWLSGESRAIARRRGDIVHGGAVNAGSAFVLRVTRVGADTAMSAIHRLMERALGERPRWVEAAQRASGFFVGFILLASLGAGLAWLAIDPSRAIWIAVAVLVITCPCALALAAPAVATAATGALARIDFVTARGHATERLAAATDFVFDKTGTLTYGTPRLLATTVLGTRSERECGAIASAMAARSSHPLDRALAGRETTHLLQEHESRPGEGIEARIDGRRYRLGNARFVGGLCGEVPALDCADSVVYLGDVTGCLAFFRLGDGLRPDALEAMRQFRDAGLRLHLLSGDHPGAVRSVAAELGIEHYRSRATPREKQEAVRELQLRGARVAMVGDGINDAPVLAQADVSIAMGGGSDLAQVHADAVLLSDSLVDLAAAVRIARRARRVMRQNLGWALGYNLIAIPLAVAGLVTPLIAGIGMAASSLLVIANAARVRR